MASYIHTLIAGVGLDPSQNYSLFTVRPTQYSHTMTFH